MTPIIPLDSRLVRRPLFRGARACLGTCLALCTAAAWGGRVSAAPGEAEQLRIIETMAVQMRARIDALPELLPAGQALGEAREVTVVLNRDPVIVEDQRFDAVVVTAPAAKAWFAWAFACPPNVARWYILRESGDMRGFRDFIRKPRSGLTGAGALEPTDRAEITFQKLDAAGLSPETRYILWFSFKDAAPAKFSLRAGFFPGTAPANARLPALLFPAGTGAGG